MLHYITFAFVINMYSDSAEYSYKLRSSRSHIYSVTRVTRADQKDDAVGFVVKAKSVSADLAMNQIYTQC